MSVQNPSGPHSSPIPQIIHPKVSSDFADLEQLNAHFLQYPHSVEQFLASFLKCPRECPRATGDLHNELEDESDECNTLLIPPDTSNNENPSPIKLEQDRVLEVLKQSTCNVPSSQRFTFTAADPDTFVNRALIYISFPGHKLPQNPAAMPANDVSSYALVFLSDPFSEKSSSEALEALRFIADIAHSLFSKHVPLHVYLLVFFPLPPSGKEHRGTARIVRVDRACAVVSRAFELEYAARADVLHQFFGSFGMPGAATGRVVMGSDPAVGRLTDSDVAWARGLLRPGEAWTDRQVEEARTFRIRAASLTEGDAAGYVEFVALRRCADSASMFGRGTVVWECLRRGEESGKRYVVKDSWRDPSVGYGSLGEVAFYEQIMSAVVDDIEAQHPCLPGLARMVAAEYRGQVVVKDETRDGKSRSESFSSSSSGCSASATSPSSELSYDLCLDQDPDCPDAEEEDVCSSLPPGDISTYTVAQCTVVPIFSRDAMRAVKTREHVRFALDILGRPLSSFRNTRELVTAIRDAVLGHQQAIEAGVLHRDVSEGNILITDDESVPFRGLLTDFDYSQHLDPSADEPPSGRHYDDTLTGTMPFIAVEQLKAQGVPHAARHDLESFYWVLIALVLQHTPHTHEMGQEAYALTFHPAPLARTRPSPADLRKALCNQKMLWFCDSQCRPLAVRANVPLSELLKELGPVFWKGSSVKAPHYVEVTHERLLDVLNRALDRVDWPEEDRVLIRPHPEECFSTYASVVMPELRVE